MPYITETSANTGTEQIQFNSIDAELFSSLTPAQIISGETDYRCFYLKNRHPTMTFASITLWSDLNCNSTVGSTSNSQYVQFSTYEPSGGTRSGTGTDNVSIGSTTTAPTGITFAFANSESTGMTITNLLPGQCIPIWIKRVVNSSTTVTQQDVLSYLRMKVMY
jgi:hypothetical protein